MRMIHINMPLFQRIDCDFLLDLEKPFLQGDNCRNLLEHLSAVGVEFFFVVQLVTFFSFLGRSIAVLYFVKAHKYVT